MKILKRDVERARHDADVLEREYLRQHGWAESSNYPGSYWMWSKTLPDGRTLHIPTAGMAASVQGSLTPDPEEQEHGIDCRDIPS